MRILVTGAKGQLGIAVMRELLGKKQDFDFRLMLTVSDDTSWNSLYNLMKEYGLLDERAEITTLDIRDCYAVKTSLHSFVPEDRKSVV